MITKYKTTRSKDSIEQVEILRETKMCVFLASTYHVKGVRENKRSDWGSYYDTWQEAHDYLLAQAHMAVSQAESRFEYAMENRRKVEALKEHP